MITDFMNSGPPSLQLDRFHALMTNLAKTFHFKFKRFSRAWTVGNWGGRGELGGTQRVSNLFTCLWRIDDLLAFLDLGRSC